MQNEKKQRSAWKVTTVVRGNVLQSTVLAGNCQMQAANRDAHDSRSTKWKKMALQYLEILVFT